MWDCTERKSTGPVSMKPADRPEHVRLPWLVYPVFPLNSFRGLFSSFLMGPYFVFILLNTGSLLGVYSHTFGSLIKLAAVAYCSSGKTTHGRGLADSRCIFPHVSGPLSCRSTMDCLFNQPRS